jgi:DNA-binding NarL/FixJ family response regulator
MTRVLIADDQPLVRVGLRKILDFEPDVEVVGEAGDGEDAVRQVGRLAPDVVLMDIRMPVLDGIEATRRLTAAHPETRVLILTTFGLDGYVYESLRAGASGFMLKDAPPEEIVGAVRIVARGEALLAPAVTRAVIEEFARQPPPAVRRAPPAALAELTPREREVLTEMVAGYLSKQIADHLNISTKTVEAHRLRICHKFNVRTGMELAAKLREIPPSLWLNLSWSARRKRVEQPDANGLEVRHVAGDDGQVVDQRNGRDLFVQLMFGVRNAQLSPHLGSLGVESKNVVVVVPRTATRRAQSARHPAADLRISRLR